MKFKRLSQKSGEVLDVAKPQDGDSDEKIIRPGILVHAGPNGEAMKFESGDGPISFDEARIKRIVEKHNAGLAELAKQYGGFDKMPPGAFPPILDSHENDSNHRVVGRLASPLRFEKRDVPKVGKNVPCAVADIHFLGKDTVTRVKDGRIYHLSIGIDDKTDTLGELSTVIEPAAPGAMLLKKGQPGQTSPKKETTKVSAKLKRMKAHTERVTKLAAMKTSLTTLQAGISGASSQIKLAAQKSAVSHRLTGLMRSGKLTPAEFKKLDLVKLSALPAESFDAAVSLYDAREPVINPGQRGSTDAPNFSELGQAMEKRQLKRLKGEVFKDFKRLGVKLKGAALAAADEEHDDEPADGKKLEGGNKVEHVDPKSDPHAVPGEMDQHLAEYAKHLEHLGKHLAAGNVEEAAKCHKAMAAHHAKHGMKHMGAGPGDVHSEDAKAGMDHMQAQVDEMGTQLGRLAGMVDELMSVEKDEGHDLEKEGEPEPEPKIA